MSILTKIPRQAEMLDKASSLFSYLWLDNVNIISMQVILKE